MRLQFGSCLKNVLLHYTSQRNVVGVLLFGCVLASPQHANMQHAVSANWCVFYGNIADLFTVGKNARENSSSLREMSIVRLRLKLKCYLGRVLDTQRN